VKGRILENGDTDRNLVASEFLRVVGDRLLESTPGIRKTHQQRFQARTKESYPFIE
jgi:hypothetical protein